MQWPGDFALRERTTTGQRWADEEPRPERTLEGYYNEPPFQLDTFDRDLLRQPDFNSRQGQAALGRARLSLPSAQAQRAQDDGDDQYAYSATAAPSQSVRNSFGNSFAAISQKLVNDSIETGHAPYESRFDDALSPPLGYGQLSSPAYQASQRHANGRSSVRNHEHPTTTAQPTQPASRSSFSTAPMERLTETSHPPVRDRGAPIVQGIELVSVYKLPDRFRSLFSFPLFNAVQSKCFDSVYNTNQNFVLASPTGSGKTVIFELAICRLIHGWQTGSFKVVYMAPIKSLCAERTRDWKAKFSSLNLVCEEMTGDSDMASLQRVRSADIIVTTPEKWDSMTRKWRDHEKLVQLIKLFLIDEVHILNKDRGASLEAVVSRMKSVGSDVRFVALSATVPNSQDIATWLGRDANNTNIPAIRERFGEEFRPVKLEKHVCGYRTTSNAFAFDSTLNKKLPDVIKRYSHKKPIMVFCFTRKSCADAAKYLASWSEQLDPQQRYWEKPFQALAVEDKALQSTVPAGVAFHHAGLSPADRSVVEKAYLSGELSVICCTSTLAVGVNLPCHMVIIKNTVNYESSTIKECSDLEVMQMIGRAGRPQFDDSAVAVIMTRMPQVKHYEQMVNGQELLESCLHLNLIEHLNAEIGLGTIHDLPSAKRWLESTFLRVRLQHNPRHYRIEGDTGGNSLDERLGHICANGISELHDHDLVNRDPHLKTTEYGEAMARYCVDLTTMKAILGLPPKPKLSEILSTLAQAHEFRELRFRAGEKQIYKEINSSSTLRFPIKVDLAQPAHKVTLLVQAVLGEIDITNDSNHKTQNGIDQNVIFQHANRIVRCIIECQSYRSDAVGIRNSLMLSRSLAVKAWDDSPLIMKQLEGVGPAAVRKLVGANIRTMDELDAAEPGRIEQILKRNPPCGLELLDQVKQFPRLTVSVRMEDQPLIRKGDHVAVTFLADIGFLNKNVPIHYRGAPVFVIMLVETSDGRKVHFCRTSAQKLAKASTIRFCAALTNVTQSINCYVMCDELGGTFHQTRLIPGLSASAFDSIKETDTNEPDEPDEHTKTPVFNTSRARVSQLPARRVSLASDAEDWGAGGIKDSDFPNAADQEPWDSDFVDVDELDSGPMAASPSIIQEKKGRPKSTAKDSNKSSKAPEPKQLRNGKWECAHHCKDKQSCKHICCRNGMDKKPKIKKLKASTEADSQAKDGKAQSKTQSKLQLQSKKPQSGHKTGKALVEAIDLSQKSRQVDSRGSKLPFRTRPGLCTQTNATRFLYEPENRNSISGGLYAEVPDEPEPAIEDDVNLMDEDLEESLMDDLPDSANDMFGQSDTANYDNANADTGALADDEWAFQDDDEDMLDAALVGCEDSYALRASDDVEELNTALPFGGTSSAVHVTQRLDHGSGSELFLSERLEADDLAGLPGDTSAIVVDSLGAGLGDQMYEDDGATKRKRDDDQHTPFLRPSAQTPIKRQKMEASVPPDDSAFSIQQSSHQEEMVVGEDESAVPIAEEENKGARRPNEELRAWLAAEFGDTVELVDELDV